MSNLIEYRSRPLHEVKFVADAEGTFEGYASTFGNIDSYGDAVAKSAFQRTLSEWKSQGSLPPMLINHAMDDGLPAGRWLAMSEDERGLKVKGRLSALDTDFGRRVHSLLRDEALNGLSIGFTTKTATFGDGKAGSPRRTLVDVDLVEVSLTPMPANRRATIDIESVKAFGLTSPKNLERLLRDVGVPRNAAKAIVAGGWSAMVDCRDGDEQKAAKLAASIVAAADRLSKLASQSNGNRNGNQDRT